MTNRKIDDHASVYELPESVVKKRFGGAEPSKESRRILKRECELATKHLRAFCCELLKNEIGNAKIFDVEQRLLSVDKSPLFLYVDILNRIVAIDASVENGVCLFKDIDRLNNLLSNIGYLMQSNSIPDLKFNSKRVDLDILESIE